MKKTTPKLISLCLTLFMCLGVVASAQTDSNANPPTDTNKGSDQNLNYEIPNPFRGGDSLFDLLETIITEILLPIGGVLAVLMFIYSGFLYVTAQGNETKIGKAHQALLYTAVGTVILLGSWAISGVLQNTVEQITR